MGPSVRALVAELESFSKHTERLDSLWHGLPMDIMRLILTHLGPADVQATLLVCKEWQSGVAGGVLALKPRTLRVASLATRQAISADFINNQKIVQIYRYRLETQSHH